jgi:hypothetical protein
MKNLKFGDYCYYKNEGWLYIGMDEDGTIHVCRPVKASAFNIIEFEQIYLDNEDAEGFYRDNGECFTDYCKRKGIEVPRIGEYSG